MTHTTIDMLTLLRARGIYVSGTAGYDPDDPRSFCVFGDAYLPCVAEPRVHIVACDRARIDEVRAGQIDAYDRVHIGRLIGGTVRLHDRARVDHVAGGVVDTYGRHRIGVLDRGGSLCVNRLSPEYDVRIGLVKIGADIFLREARVLIDRFESGACINSRSSGLRIARDPQTSQWRLTTAPGCSVGLRVVAQSEAKGETIHEC